MAVKSTAEAYGSATVDGTVEEGRDGMGAITGRPTFIRMADNAEEMEIGKPDTPVPAEHLTAVEGERAEAGAVVTAAVAATTTISDRYAKG
jgi:hypothetical protein